MSKKTARAEKKTAQNTAQPNATKGGKSKTSQKSSPVAKARKEPKTAAVTVTCPPGRYEETMRETCTKVNFNALGIEGIKVKRAVTGNLIFEILGKDGNKLAEKLAVNLKKVFSEKRDVKVDRPTKMAELCFRGHEESITWK